MSTRYRLLVFLVLPSLLASGCHRVFPFPGGNPSTTDGPVVKAHDMAIAETSPDATTEDVGLTIDAARPASNYQTEWVKHLSSIKPDEATAAIFDGQGNVYAAGFLMAGINFGGGSRGTDGLPDGWVVKYDSKGDHVWSILLPGESFDFPYGLALAKSQLVMTGRFTRTIDFGGGEKNTVGYSADVGLALFDTDGGLVDGRLFGGDQADGGRAVATDLAGNIYLAGLGRGTWDMGGEPLELGAKDGLWVGSFTAEGDHRWSRGFAGELQRPDLATAAGSVCVVSGFYGAVLIEPDELLESAGGTDSLVFCISSSDGTTRWARRFGGPDSDTAVGVTINTSGQLFVVGKISGDVDIVSDETTSASVNGAAFSARFDPVGGAPVWARAFTSTGSSEAVAVTSPLSLGACIAGVFSSEITFGQTQYNSKGDDDIFVGCVDDQGNTGWSMHVGGDSHDDVEDLTSGAKGELLLVGSQEGSGDYGNGSYTAPEGGSDGLLIKLRPVL